MIRNGILSVLIATVWIGCALASPPKEKGKALAGSWGGSHVSLEITGETGRIEYDCAHGTIDGPVVLDREGRFEAAGTHTPERGGPVREGEEEPSQPARYRGQVTGKTMTLTVTLVGSGENVGTFTLTQGAGARLVKCL